MILLTGMAADVEQNVQRVSLFDETLAVRCQPA